MKSEEPVKLKYQGNNAVIFVGRSNGMSARYGFYAENLAEALEHIPEYMKLYGGNMVSFSFEWSPPKS